VLTPGRQTWHLPTEIASNATILPIFEGMSEIQRLLIGRTVNGLDVR
jgi:alkylation response protein AidB-like acyl-CoA dehydrogenase